MTASTWLVIAIILFTLAGALFAAAVIMFFVMNIPSIIGDLSGRTLAKGIQNIRSENAYANSKNARAANRRNNPDSARKVRIEPLISASRFRLKPIISPIAA